MTQPLLCIYHSQCDDGFGAAYSVRHAAKTGQLDTFWGGQVEFFPAVHHGRKPDVTDRDVVMVDFCYPLEVMNEMVLKAKSILVLDHHKSSMLDMVGPEWKGERTTYAEVQFANNKGKAVFNMLKSGAMLAWEHFNPGIPAPEFIEYIQDRDLWLKQKPRHEEFTAGLRSYPMDFETWDKLFMNGFDRQKDLVPLTADEKADPRRSTSRAMLIAGFHRDCIHPIVNEGVPVVRYKQQLVDSAVKASYWVTVEVPAGLKLESGIAGPQQGTPATQTPVLVKMRASNCIPALSSEVGEALAVKYNCIGMTFMETFRGYSYSLRSRGGKDDVSVIAAAMGGGGHAAAAGFKSEERVHKRWDDGREDTATAGG